MTSLLSDELLQQLIAVGHVDVLVGLPTLNHADTVATVVRAVQASFHRELARERTLLMNVDGGSGDGTPEIVRQATSAQDGGTVLASQSLRTRHRISTPYHGVPGKANALRTLFAAADLLAARSLLILDPEVVSLTPEGIAALVRPVLAGAAHFATPAYARHPLDGPLVTQVVRPLFRAAFGLALREPLAGELACSAEFAAHCLDQPHWDDDALRTAIDVWLSAVAASGPFQVVEVRLGARRLAPRARPGLSDVVPQVLEALFSSLQLQERAWTARACPASLQVYGPLGAMPYESGPTDREVFSARFREGVSALGGLLGRALRQGTLDGLREAASFETPVLPDPLWATVVCELAAAYRRAAVSREHLVQAAVPLYLGRVAAFASDNERAPEATIEQRLEELSLTFERCRPELLELWTAAR